MSEIQTYSLAPLPDSETEIVEALGALLTASFGDGCKFALEVRSHGTARTDIVVLTSSSELVAIEVKRTHWRRAIAQAILNRFCVDRSYVALWASQITDQLLEEAKRQRLGVISVDHTRARIEVEAPRATPNVSVRDRILQHLQAEM